MNPDEYRVVAEIDLQAVLKNVRALMKVKPACRAYAVVKADAYGHGAVKLARFLKNEVFGFAVATPAEALSLRDAGIGNEILILGAVPEEDLEILVRREIRLTVFDVRTASALSEAAERVGKPAYIHVKVDTGMGRIGLVPDETGLQTVCEILSKPGLIGEGIFTHFATMDAPDESHALSQAVRFQGFLNLLEKNGITFPLVHLSNSAAMIRKKIFPAENAVRLGISMYGVEPSSDVKYPDILTPVLSLKSRITYVKEIDPGTPVSYGETFVSSSRMKVATVSAGYADGVPRGMSNRGEVLVRGKRAKILGRICMDQFMIDVTGIPEAKAGDEVVICGKQGKDRITAYEIEKWSGRFPYEFLSLIPDRVPRRYLGE